MCQMFEKHDIPSENEELSKSQRRRSSSIFYVPLLLEIDKEIEQNISSKPKDIMSPPCGFNWSGNDVDFEDDDDYTYPEKKLPPPSTPKPENKRYGVLIGSLTLNDSTTTIASNHSNSNINNTTINDHQIQNNLDDDDSEISRIQTNTSTPIVQMKSRSRNNILSVSNTSSSLSTASKRLTIKEKSSTLPQAASNAGTASDNAIISSTAASSYFVDVPTNTFPPKNKVNTIVNSSMESNQKSSSRKYSHSDTSITSTTNMVSPSNQSKKPLSFIRRTHSTKVARSNSILKTFSTTKGILSTSSGDNMRAGNQHAEHDVHHLPFELLNKILCSDVCGELLKSYFVKRNFIEPNNSLGE